MKPISYLLACVLLMSACKKEKTQPTQSTSQNVKLTRITEVHYGQFNDTTYTSFSYNADGYVTNYNREAIYYLEDFQKYDRGITYHTFTRNSNNKIVSQTTTGAVFPSGTANYIYNSNNQPTLIDYTGDAGSKYNVQYTYNSNKKVNTVQFEFSTDKRFANFVYNSNKQLTKAVQNFTTVSGTVSHNFDQITHDTKHNYADAIKGFDHPYLLLDIQPVGYGDNNILTMMENTPQGQNQFTYSYTYTADDYPETVATFKNNQLISTAWFTYVK